MEQQTGYTLVHIVLPFGSRVRIYSDILDWLFMLCISLQMR